MKRTSFPRFGAIFRAIIRFGIAALSVGGVTNLKGMPFVLKIACAFTKNGQSS